MATFITTSLFSNELGGRFVEATQNPAGLFFYVEERNQFLGTRRAYQIFFVLAVVVVYPSTKYQNCRPVNEPLIR